MSDIDHHPPHIYLDDTWYFITASIYRRLHLLKPQGYKDLVHDHLQSLVVKFHIKLAAWVILDNHYHILIKSKFGAALSTFFRQLHGRTSFELNARDEKRGRQVWHNYWDTCLRTEADYWTRLNYIHYNPIKHRYVSRMEDWPFSSYGDYLGKKGEEWLMDSFQMYPVIDFTDRNDDF